MSTCAVKVAVAVRSWVWTEPRLVVMPATCRSDRHAVSAAVAAAGESVRAPAVFRSPRLHADRYACAAGPASGDPQDARPAARRPPTIVMAIDRVRLMR